MQANINQITIADILNLDLKIFRAAYLLAEDVHKTQKRRDGKPYMTHIDAVIVNTYIFLKTNHSDITDDTLENILCVASLHDGIEDNPEYCTPARIFDVLYDAIIGPKGIRIGDIYQIRYAVQAITKKNKGEELYHEYCLRVKNNEWARIVKLSDLAHNLSDLSEGNLKQKYDLTLYFLNN